MPQDLRILTSGILITAGRPLPLSKRIRKVRYRQCPGEGWGGGRLKVTDVRGFDRQYRLSGYGGNGNIWDAGMVYKQTSHPG